MDIYLWIESLSLRLRLRSHVGLWGLTRKGQTIGVIRETHVVSAARFAGFDHRVASFLTWSVCQFGLAMFHQQNEIKPSLAGHNSLLSIGCSSLERMSPRGRWRWGF
ncbi:hypothetical protein V6N13_069165 [Hibiscus sabdariffa]